MGLNIVAYAHSDGFLLCPSCATEMTETEGFKKVARYQWVMKDAGSESGLVQPVFSNEEWDCPQSCDHCDEELDVNVLEDYDDVSDYDA